MRTNKKTPNIATPSSPELTQRLAELQRQAADLQRQADALVSNMKLARGTRDITQPAADAVAGRPSLADRMSALLREAPHSLPELALALDTSAGKAKATLEAARDNVVNVGTAESPRWFWKVGDGAPAPVLVAAVEALIRDRPATWQELIVLTGARGNRISGAISTLHKSGRVELLNLGAGNKARWFIIPEGAHRPQRGGD